MSRRLTHAEPAEMGPAATRAHVTTSSWAAFALFTERARTALVRARHNAGAGLEAPVGAAHLLFGLLAGERPAELQRLRPAAVGTGRGVENPAVLRSHLLIGLSDDTRLGHIRLLGMTCDDGYTAESLRRRGLPVTEVWARVPSPAGPDHELCAHHAPFMADVADTLQEALEAAAQFGHDRVDILHLALALAHRKPTLLVELGVDPATMRRDLSATLSLGAPH